MVFFDKGKVPELKEPADNKKSPVYDKKKVEKKPVPVSDRKPQQDIDDMNLEINNIPNTFSPLAEKCKFTYKVKDGKVEDGKTSTIV